MQIASNRIDAIRTEGFEALFDGSELESKYRRSLVKCAVGCVAFDVDWDRVADESEYKQ